MTHPAAHLIGQAWPENACFAFVSEYVRNRLHAVLPGVDEVRGSGWRRVPLASPDDVVVMQGPQGRRHVGVWVETPSRVGVLHAHGTVRFETLHTLQSHGYSKFEFWRHHGAA